MVWVVTDLKDLKMFKELYNREIRLWVFFPYLKWAHYSKDLKNTSLSGLELILIALFSFL